MVPIGTSIEVVSGLVGSASRLEYFFVIDKSCSLMILSALAGVRLSPFRKPFWNPIGKWPDRIDVVVQRQGGGGDQTPRISSVSHSASVVIALKEWVRKHILKSLARTTGGESA